MTSPTIDDFVRVRFTIEGKDHGGVASTENEGLSDFFGKGIKNFSSPDSYGITEHAKCSFAFKTGDVVSLGSDGGKYLVSNVQVEYHSKGFNTVSEEPFVLVRVSITRE